MWLTRLAITRPVVIWMALAAIALLGLVAYSRLPAELNPRVEIPTLTVITVYPGAGPQEIETLVTRPMEDAAGTVNNLRDVYSSSQDSVSILSMDFEVGTDLDSAVAAVREKVDAARALLPPDARAPIVAKLDINAQPVLYLGLYGDAPIRQIREAVDSRLKPRLARVPGVAAVNVVGGAEREIRVEADAARLEQNGLTIEDVANAVKAANRSIPAGSLTQGRREFDVRTLGAFTSLEDIRQAQIFSPQLMARSLPLSPQLAGLMKSSAPSAPPAPLTIGDVATVVDRAAAPKTLTRVNGRESVGIVITKASDANTVAVVDGVKRTLEEMKEELPPGIAPPVISRDESVTVRDALEDVNATLVLGAILAMTVVFLFLRNFRGTVIVAIALPACMVATFLVMYFAGLTLNQMTLLALSLSVGILIDDSIVVLESITRHLGRGEPPMEAAFNGRTEIGFAGVTLTLVDVVVFLPIAFMGGVVGAFFKEFGLTIAAATLFSLVVSFTVTPALAARWYRRGEDPEGKKGVFRGLDQFYHAMNGFYRRIILMALRSRGWILAFAAVALAATLLVTLPSLGTEFLPATDQGQISITVELPPESSLGATDAVTREIERRIAGVPEVVNTVTTVGEILGGFGAIPQQGPQFAQINVRLREKADPLGRLTGLFAPPAPNNGGARLLFPNTGGTASPGIGGRGAEPRRRSDEEVAADLRARLRGVAGARITVATVRTAANVGAPVQIQLRGMNLDALASAAAQLRSAMAQMPGILDPDVSLRRGRPEIQVRIDRARAAALGVPLAQAGAILRTALEGDTESTYREGGKEYPIRVQMAGMNRDEPGDLRGVTVGFSGGRAVTLGQVAEIGAGRGWAAIDRVNGRRMVAVTANLAPGYPLGNALNDIEARMADIPMPGIERHESGEAAVLTENAPYMALALGMAVILVYLVMASLFNSLLNPFTIMFTLPMALVGALGALALTGETLSLVAGIGILMLMGLMGRNAILLIDYTGTLRARGVPRDEAVAEAGATRLRPILMTTLATIFGMLPVALRMGRASELRAPMAIVVIGGLLVSTLLTLVVIPVLYTLFDDMQARFGRPGERV
jgi:HAE1 family hydrophobic/amphiphilic exporter-1